MLQTTHTRTAQHNTAQWSDYAFLNFINVFIAVR